MNWLNRNASAIEALGTITTALVALAALIAIPWQMRASAALQAEQSARDIYREFVALSVNKPGFADPDYCAIKTDPLRLTAYSYYMEYLLYTAEQVTAVSDTWIPVMQSHLSQHHGILCDTHEGYADTAPVAALIASQRAQCAAATSCD
jgi:hypothetical protein